MAMHSDSITVNINAFFITYLPSIKAPCCLPAPTRCPMQIAPPCAIAMQNRYPNITMLTQYVRVAIASMPSMLMK